VVLAGAGAAAATAPLLAIGFGAAFTVSLLIDVNLHRRN
jgi:hypothetical protein